MASGKKKLDEYHLKILRQLVSVSSNKQCFDCHQRGPTYVNVTIGSFVCTTCSGMLRGLTPPHRVKSISMATFTPDEIEFIKAKGNEYCRRVWLGLCDTEPPTKDEQQIKDFMISKYERKRYYLNQSTNSSVITNGTGSSTPNGAVAPSTPLVNNKVSSAMNGSSSITTGQVTAPTIPHPISVPQLKPPSSNNNRSNGTHIMAVNGISFNINNNSNTNKNLNKSASNSSINNNSNGVSNNSSSNNSNSSSNVLSPDQLFAADFTNATSDPFSSSALQCAPTASAQASFANFDNNPIFNSSSSAGSLSLTEPWLCSTTASHFSLPPTLNFDVPVRQTALQHNVAPTNRWSFAGISEKGEDRYAALKDLDSLMKSQQQQQQHQQQQQQHQQQQQQLQQQQQTSNGQPIATTGLDWGVNGGGNASVGDVWMNQTIYNSASQNTENSTTVPNPFTGENVWGGSNLFNANPFRNNVPREPVWCGNGVPNGQLLSNGFPTSQSLNFAPTKTSWNPISNPFTVGNNAAAATGHHSSNPFL